MSGRVLEQRQIIADKTSRLRTAYGLLVSVSAVGIAGRENMHLDILALLGEVNSAGWIIR